MCHIVSPRFSGVGYHRHSIVFPRLSGVGYPRHSIVFTRLRGVGYHRHCMHLVFRICGIAVVWLLRSPEGLHEEHSSAQEGDLFPVVLQVQVVKNANSTFLKESHRNK